MSLYDVPDTVEMTECFRIGRELEKMVKEIRTRREAAEKLAKESAVTMARAATKLAKAGLSRRDVGELLGVSFQRAHQLVK